MDSLSSVTVDAGVLAVPELSCTFDDAHQYIDTMLDWSRLLDETWVAIHMSERASEALIADDLYSFRDQLRELFKVHGIVEYDVNTVATTANRLLAITPFFETYYRVKDVLTEGLETDPDVIRLTTYDCLQSDLARCITMIAILRKHCSQQLGGHSLILRDAPKQLIKIRAQILVLEHERVDIPTLPCPPEFFEGDVLVCDNFRGLIECLDETAILVSASDNLGVELSIRVALFKYDLSLGDTPDWSTTLAPNIGSEFRETCQQCCTDQAASLQTKILRAVVETIRSQNLPAVHALRTGAGGKEPQRLRGSDKAQRRDIDQEFHLHYWDCGKGTIELASVVYHNDFSIPE